MSVRRLCLILFCLFCFSTVAWAEGPPATLTDPVIQAQSQQLDTRPLEEFLRETSRTWQGYGPDVSLRDFLSMYKGDNDGKFAPGTIMSGLLRYLLREVVGNAGLLLKVILLAMLAAILQNVQSAFESEAAGKLAHAVVYLALVGLAVTGFGLAVSTARQVMDVLSGFMLAMLPTLLTVLAGTGGVTSAALLHPLMVTFSTTMAKVMASVVFPLAFLSAMLEIVSGLNENFKLTHLAGLLRQGANYTLGLTFTIFLGVVSVKGMAGAAADGVTMKAARFAVSNFVPVVGKMFSDASDLIYGSSLLLKNALGMLGLAVVFFIVIFPLMKILSLVVIYQLAGALIQPVGAGAIAKMLGSMARSLQFVFATLAMVGLMFFLGIAVIVGAGNLTAMVR